MNTVKVENCKTLFIGRRGENEVTEVVFDFSEWQEQFGTGVIDLYVKRNLDVDAYPVVLSVDGTVATWLVTATDTNVADYGKAEYVYTVNGKIAKSAVFTFYVAEDIGQASGEAPDPYEDWIETLTGLGTETQLNAQAAEQSANDAAESAESAATSADQSEDSAEDAEAWAIGERNGEPVTEGDPTYNNNAKFWAGKAMTDAPVTSVNGKAGDIVLNLDDIPNGVQYARTTPAQVQQIGDNAADIADIEELIPAEAGDNNQLADKNYVDSRDQTNTDAIAAINAKIPSQASASNQLADKILVNTKLMAYRKATDQDAIDSAQDGKINALTNLLNNKQSKITANGILKGNGNGGISAAVAGMDYLPTSALYAYRSANAQDVIDNAQNENINKNTAAINTMQPAATAADIGKALIVKTVADGKPTSYEYGEAGGGGSALTAGDGIDITEDVISNTQGIEYIVGTQTAATSKWTGVSTDETLKVGKIIAYYLPFAGTSTAATLALTMADGTTTREISLQLKPNATVTTQFPAGSIIILVYDGSYWRVNASYDTDTNTNPTGYCLTNGSVAAKSAACSFGYRGDTNYFPCLFRFANTATDATLAITTYAPEAAPIYVNGARTSASNTFSAGVILFLYYNGAYYCYNDGRFPILVDGAVTSVQEYAAGLLVNYRDLKSAIDTIADISISVGKNLLNPANIVTGGIQADGTIRTDGSYSSYGTSDYIPISASTDYVFSYFTNSTKTIQNGRKMVAYFDSSKNAILAEYVNQANGNDLVINSASAKYVRVSAFFSGMVFQVEKGSASTAYEPYEESGAEPSLKIKLGAEPLAQVDRLYGKKWAVCGDSFTNGATATVLSEGKYRGQKYVYPYLIGNRTGMEILKFFNGGRTLAFPAQPGSFTDSITNPNAEWYYQNIPVDTDYITIYLGINDEHHATGGGDGEDPTGVIPLGTISDTTTDTYYGAWNVVLTWLIDNRPFAHIGIIVSNGLSIEGYRTAQLDIAQKYGIPYIDMNGDSRTPVMIRSINTDIASAVRTAVTRKQAVDYDGTATGSVNLHPNDDAHEYESYFIEAFLRSI